MISADPARPEIRIIKEATSRIATHGLEGLDLKSLTADAGTSTSQFVKYIGHKDDLIALVFENAWSTVEKCISARLFRPPTNLEEVVVAVLDGVVDALEAEREPDRHAAAAAIVIAHAAVGRQVSRRLKETDGKSRFFAIVNHLRDQFAEQLGSEKEAKEALELLYGAALHRLMLATPLCASDALKFDRAAFIKLMRKMVSGLRADTERSALDSASGG